MKKSRATKKAEPKFKLTAKPLVYVLPNGTEYEIPKGLKCVRVPGECKQDGVMISNPWTLHETPAHLADEREFKDYAHTYGIIISAEFLTDERMPKADWLDYFEVRAKAVDLGTMENGDCVPSAAVIQWAYECVSSDYWEQYSADSLLIIWKEVYQAEHMNPQEFAWNYLEECDWEVYKALDKSSLLCFFNITGYWERCLNFDYHCVEFKNKAKATSHCLFIRRNW